VLSPAVDNLVAQLTRLPGIGTRTAQRLTFHLLSVSQEEALALGEAIAEMKERVHFCRDCGNLTEDELCTVCTDPRRDRTIVCVEPSDLRVGQLLYRVEQGGIEEVVLATNPNMTGEATAAYLADRLRDRVRVTRLASGLPVGGDLEYADEVTLGRALSGRRPA